MSNKVNKKIIISASDKTILKLEALAREKERTRRKLAVVAEKLRLKAKQLAATVKKRRGVERQLALTAATMAAVANAEKVSLIDKKLVEITKELQKSETRYRELLAGAPEGILVADLQTKQFRYANPAICRMFGYTETEFRRLGLADIHPKESLDHVISEFEAQARGEKLMSPNLPCRRKDGTIFYANISATKVILDGRECNLGFFTDSTEFKQMEEDLENAEIATRNVLEDLSLEKSKLERARAKEKAILLSIGDGLIATNNKGGFILINKATEKLLGMKSGEVMGKVLAKVIPIEDEKGVPIPLEKRPINMALATGTTTTTTTTTTGLAYYYRGKDRTRFPVAITVTPVILDGKVIGAIEVFRDITREKEIDQAKTEFVSLASHQLRTPLSAVNWYAEMLLAGDAGRLNDKQKEYLKEVYKGNQRMVALVNALLNVSRLELGTFVIEPVPTNIINIARSVINEQKPKIEAKKLKLIEEYSDNLPKLKVDPKLLRIVFQNILSNAVKFTPDKGKIMFEFGLSGSDVLIKISDTGYGIPKAQQDKIFTKLFRADNVQEKDTEGTGLGLYIVKSIIEHSGGKVWFKSPSSAAFGKAAAGKEENPGTTFYVTLPLAGMKKKEGTKTLE